MMTLQQIETLISDNDTDRAINELDSYIAQNPDCERAYMMRGNLYRKLDNWRMAITDYCHAREINPAGDGSRAYDAAIQILNFYNTDLFNP